MRHRAQHVVAAAGVLPLPLAQHGLDLDALQVVLAAAKAARDDREPAQVGPALQIGLGDIGQRADHDMAAVGADQLGRHALQAPAEEHVHQQRDDDVVTVVAERDLGGAQLARHAVQDAAPQPRAQAAHRLSLGHEALDDAVGILVLDPERHAQAAQVRGQHLGREARLLLVEVDGDEVEAHRRARAQRQQDVEQRVAVLAAGQADHDPVALLDHRVVGDRLPDLALQPLAQLVGLERGLARVGAAAAVAGLAGGGTGRDAHGGVVDVQRQGGGRHSISSRMPKTSTPTASQSG